MLPRIAVIEKIQFKHCIKLEYEGNYKGLYKGTWWRAFSNGQDAAVHLRMVNEDLSLMRDLFNPEFHRLTLDLQRSIADEIARNRSM